MARIEITKSKGSDLLVEMRNDERFHPIIIDHLIELHEYGVAGIFILHTAWNGWKDGTWKYISLGKRFVDSQDNKHTVRELLSVFYGRQILVKTGPKIELDVDKLTRYMAPSLSSDNSS